MKKLINKNECWLIGAGLIAVEYSKVLEHYSIDYKVFGRGSDSAKEFERITSKFVILDDLYSYSKRNNIANFAIVAVDIESLFRVSLSLIAIGVKNVLVEKPGALLLKDLETLKEYATIMDVNVLVAYNRRFYDNVEFIKNSAISDGGINSINFEFTEWSSKITESNKNLNILNNWLICNSSHVIDLSFFIAGRPIQMTSYIKGNGEINWYQRASTFVGSGLCESGTLFSYSSCWIGPGNWSIEIITNKRRYRLSPLEELSIRNHGELKFQSLPFYKSTNFKSGFEKMLNKFFNGEFSDFLSLSEQIKMFEVYNVIQSGGIYLGKE